MCKGKAGKHGGCFGEGLYTHVGGDMEQERWDWRHSGNSSIGLRKFVLLSVFA